MSIPPNQYLIEVTICTTFSGTMFLCIAKRDGFKCAWIVLVGTVLTMTALILLR